MIKNMDLFFALRKHRVSALVFILWFTSVSFDATQGVTVRTPSNVTAQCGQNVTLSCNVSSSHQMNFLIISWVDGNKTICETNSGQTDPKFLCERTSNYGLDLILINVMPVSEGKYICKVRSNVGVGHDNTYVKIQGCSRSSALNAACSFSGVHRFHWFMNRQVGKRKERRRKERNRREKKKSAH